MLKVGIITTFRQPNWGSVLQAYALQKIIDSLGYDAENIDYKYPNEYHWNRGKKKQYSPSKGFKAKLIHKCHLLLCHLHIIPYRKMEILSKFISQNIKTSKLYLDHKQIHSDPPIYDIYVAGSDQIWNPNTMMGDMTYMFDFAPVKSIKVSYASSFSCSTIPTELQEGYIRNLSTFSAISVREKNGSQIIKSLLNKEAKVVLDPTLLVDKQEWESIAKKAMKVDLPPAYILCYMLAYTFDAEGPMSQLLEKVQVQYKLPIIFLMKPPKGFFGETFILPQNYNLGVPEFLNLIHKSSLVVSSSFHGTAFALNFGRPLIALAKSNQDDRISSLLNQMKLTKKLVLTDKISITNIDPYYSVEEEQKQLRLLRNDSIIYLQSALLSYTFNK